MSVVKYYAIIVGGGSGSRMQSDTPKQFMLLNGRPILMHSIEAFRSSKMAPEIIVVLPYSFHEYWDKLCGQYNFRAPHHLVTGGQERFHSVQNGLKSITGSAIVAIHDAVRPCVSHQLIDSAYRQAATLGNAVAAVKSRDSIRQTTSAGTKSLRRENIYLVQTPQVFPGDVLIKAYEQDYREDFTDDASVVEHSGVEIKLIEGDIKNIKVTYPEDMLMAEVYLESVK